MKLISSLLLGLCFSNAATAATVQFCFRFNPDYADGGFSIATGISEDYWVNNSSQQSRGSYAKIDLSDGTPVWTGYTDDGFGSNGAGCTPQVFITDPNQVYTITFKSKARVQGNYVYATDNGSQWSYWTTTTVTGAGLSSNVLRTITSNPPSAAVDAFRLMRVGAYSIYRHAGGLNAETFYVAVDDSFTASRYSGGVVEVKRSQVDLKFVISHEIGHNVSDLAAGGTYSGDYSYNPISTICDDEVGDHHKMDSIEYAASAFAEGFAHFYAADVWNSHSESDCVFRYYARRVGVCTQTQSGFTFALSTPTVDCEASTDASLPRRATAYDASMCPTATVIESYPRQFMEHTCLNDSFSGKGVEVDWLRVFWDMHAASSGSTASMNSILAWIQDAFTWPNYGVYSELDSAANRAGGVLDDKWDSFKGYNGVDH